MRGFLKSIAVVTPLADYIAVLHHNVESGYSRLMNNMALLQQQLNTHAHTPR